MARQAIVTRYHGPTNSRGARVSARAAAGKVTIPWAHELDVERNHRRAAIALCERFGWKGQLYEGGLPDGTGNCYVLCEPDSYTNVWRDREHPDSVTRSLSREDAERALIPLGR